MTKSAHAKTSLSPDFETEAERTAEEERVIQRKIDRSDKKNSGDKDEFRSDAGRRACISGPATSGPTFAQA